MSEDLEKLKARLIEVEEEIQETERRVPAHSPKIPVMEDLFNLEDEREELLRKIKGV